MIDIFTFNRFRPLSEIVELDGDEEKNLFELSL